MFSYLSLVILVSILDFGLDEERCGGGKSLTPSRRIKHECGNKQPPSDCCARVKVGGYQYRFVQTEDTSHLDCLADCIYERLDLVDSPYFCFSHGEEYMLCEDTMRGCERGLFNSASSLDMIWEQGQTSVDIEDGGSLFQCEVFFLFSLKDGIKFDPINSCCSVSDEDSEDAIQSLGKHQFELVAKNKIILDCSIGVVLIQGGLSDDILKKTIACSVSDENECVTVAGNFFPQWCQIPFIYNKRKYQGCTDVESKGDSDRWWCATKLDKNGVMLDGDWGYCDSKCGYCGGSDITADITARNKKARNKKASDCGYDCIIIPTTKMEGSDLSPLTPPNVKILPPKKENYLGSPSGQYKFNIGTQQVNLSCPDTKFYHPLLNGLSSVLASCTAQYRFTIKNNNGDVLTTILNNTQLGCDPCPPSTRFIPGYLSKDELKNTKVNLKIHNIKDCFQMCSGSCSCKTILYSNKKKRCELVSQLIKKAAKKIYKDFVICAKTTETRPGNQCSSEKLTTTEAINKTAVKDDCCDSYIVRSTGDIKKYEPSTLGTFMREGTHNGKPIYKREKNVLYYSKESTWVIGSSITSSPIIKTDRIPTAKCPNDRVNWNFKSTKTKKWKVDRNTKVRCSDLCGFDISVDRERYLADINTEFIFSLFNTASLELFNVAEFRQESKMTKHKQANRKSPGVYFIILAPSTAKCQKQLFKDASRNKNRYFPVYVGNAISSNVIDLFEKKAKNLKTFYSGTLPKMCGTFLPMKQQVQVQFRVKTLTSVFNFMLNDKTLSLDNNLGKYCSTAEKTVTSLGQAVQTFHKPDKQDRCQLLIDLIKIVPHDNKYKDLIICEDCHSCAGQSGPIGEACSIKDGKQRAGGCDGVGGINSGPLTFQEHGATIDNLIFRALSGYAAYCYTRQPGQWMGNRQRAYFAVIPKYDTVAALIRIRDFDPQTNTEGCDHFFAAPGTPAPGTPATGTSHAEKQLIPQMKLFRNLNLPDMAVKYYLYTFWSPCAISDRYWKGCQEIIMDNAIESYQHSWVDGTYVASEDFQDSWVVGFEMWWQYWNAGRPLFATCNAALDDFCQRLTNQRSNAQFQALTSADLKFVWFVNTCPNYFVPNNC